MNASTRRIDLAWLALLALVAASTLSLSAGLPQTVLSGVMVLLLLAKARLVGLDFLGLRLAPAAWRRSITIGVAAIAALAWILAVLP